MKISTAFFFTALFSTGKPTRVSAQKELGLLRGVHGSHYSEAAEDGDEDATPKKELGGSIVAATRPEDPAASKPAQLRSALREQEVPLVSDAADATSPKERVIEDRQVGPTLGEAIINGPSDFPRSFRFVLHNEYWYLDPSYLDVCGLADGGYGVQTTADLDRNRDHQTSTWEWRRWICGTLCYGQKGEIADNDWGWLYNPVYGYLTVSGDKVITKANVGYEAESIWQMQRTWNGNEISDEISDGDFVKIFNLSNREYLYERRVESTCDGKYAVGTGHIRANGSDTWQIQKI